MRNLRHYIRVTTVEHNERWFIPGIAVTQRHYNVSLSHTVADSYVYITRTSCTAGNIEMRYYRKNIRICFNRDEKTSIYFVCTDLNTLVAGMMWNKYHVNVQKKSMCCIM